MNTEQKQQVGLNWHDLVLEENSEYRAKSSVPMDFSVENIFFWKQRMHKKVDTHHAKQ